jgi:hypothetical protein
MTRPAARIFGVSPKSKVDAIIRPERWLCLQSKTVFTDVNDFAEIERGAAGIVCQACVSGGMDAVPWPATAIARKRVLLGCGHRRMNVFHGQIRYILP